MQSREERSFRMLALVAADEGICLVGKQLLVNSTTGIRLVPTDCPNFELFAVSLKNPSSIPAASYLEVLREESTQLGSSVSRS